MGCVYMCVHSSDDGASRPSSSWGGWSRSPSGPWGALSKFGSCGPGPLVRPGPSLSRGCAGPSLSWYCVNFFKLLDRVTDVLGHVWDTGRPPITGGTPRAPAGDWGELRWAAVVRRSGQTLIGQGGGAEGEGGAARRLGQGAERGDAGREAARPAGRTPTQPPSSSTYTGPKPRERKRKE